LDKHFNVDERCMIRVAVWAFKFQVRSRR